MGRHRISCFLQPARPGSDGPEAGCRIGSEFVSGRSKSDFRQVPLAPAVPVRRQEPVRTLPGPRHRRVVPDRCGERRRL